MRLRPLCIVAGLLLLIAARTGAQDREGFWIGFAGGYGLADATCRECLATDREGSYTGMLRLGGTLNPSFLLGVDLNAWVDRQSGITLTFGNASATLTMYPLRMPLHLKIGFGMSYVRTDIDVPTFTGTIDGAGWGVVEGIGWDFRVGENVSITPSVNFFFGRPGNLKSGGEIVIHDWRQNVVDFSVGVTFH